jgi:deoxyribodipyrimidine photo-lyase
MNGVVFLALAACSIHLHSPSMPSAAVRTEPILADDEFPPTREAALLRVKGMNLARYAQTRNALDGAVSRLSPYITHGLISVPEVLAQVAKGGAIGWSDKFAFELGWREYFHHAWSRLGEDIWKPRHPAPAREYQQHLPDDIRQAATGVPIIDEQIRTLYTTGYLHNHARMWLASYIVHLRKVDWRVGARWMYAHLLDGDLASNTLSWQWIAGTWTGKPYLFNAENVSRYSRSQNAGTAIDCSYEEQDARARSNKAYLERPSRRQGQQEPSMFDLSSLHAAQIVPSAGAGGFAWVMHPWSLHLPDARPAVGVLVREFHEEFPWSQKRFEFVLAAMRARCSVILMGDVQTLRSAITAMHGLSAVSTLNPYYRTLLDNASVKFIPAPRAFHNPTALKTSFSSFWTSVSKESFPQ